MGKSKGIFRIWSQVCFRSNLDNSRKKHALKLYFSCIPSVDQAYDSLRPYLDVFPGQILNLKRNWNPLVGMHNNAKVIVIAVHVEAVPHPNPKLNLDEAVELGIPPDGLPKCEILVRHLTRAFTGPSAHPNYPGIFTIPYTPQKQLRYGGVQFRVSSPYVHPANAISAHQIQGATIPKSVACIDDASKRYYGMANVVTSRTPSSDNFRVSKRVTLDSMMPKPVKYLKS